MLKSNDLKLENSIELFRERLEQLISEESLNSLKVLELSMQLDELIADYYQKWV